MAELPQSDAFRRNVQKETWSQFRGSIKAKLLMLFVTVLAMAAVFALDSVRTKFKDSREKPYTAAKVAAELQKPPASPDLAAEAKRLGKAAGELKAEERYASADDAFTAVLAKTTFAKDLADAQKSTRKHYSDTIAKLDEKIRIEVQAQSAAQLNPPAPAEGTPPPDAKKAEEAKKEEAKKLDGFKKTRAELVAARTAQLSEVEQRTAAEKANLRRVFDDAGIAENAKAKFDVIQKPALNRFVEHVADPEHPLSILYDVLWYAAIVVGVLALVALLLTPLFNAVPVAGANEKFMDQIRGLFGRAPARVGMSVARAAVMAIGTAAIVSVATTAPSSPLYESGLLPASSQDEGDKKGTDDNKSKDKSNTTTTDTTGTSITDTTGTTVTDTTGTSERTPPTPPCTSNCTSADPRVDSVLLDIASLKSADESHNGTLTTHGDTLTTHGTKLDGYQGTIDAVRPLPAQMAALITEENTQKDQLRVKFKKVDDDIDKAHLKAENAETRAKEVGVQVTQARGVLEQRANDIETGVVLPYRVGERPNLMRSAFGFDRYRITDATATYVEKAGAPDTVIAAVKTMKSGDVMSNDALRRDLRIRVCGEPKNCEPYLLWRNTVIRAARVQ